MKITIIGGGIAGLTAAIAFKKAGLETVVFEAATDIKPAGAGLGLAPNAIKGLEKLGIADGIIPLGRKLPSFKILDRKGRVITENDSNKISEKFGLDNFTIHRHKLHAFLLSQLPPDTVITGKKAMDLESADGRKRIVFNDGNVYETDYLIVADGMNSEIRNKICPSAARRYAGYTCWRAVVNDPTNSITYASETWDTTGRFGIVPLRGNQIYWYACIKSRAANEVFKSYTAADLCRHFENFHNPIKSILAATQNNRLIHNDIYDLVPMANYAFGNVLIMGDAAHGATPNLGQGACQAIEDAATLYALLAEDLSLEKVFQSFEKRRIEKTHFVINQSRKVGEIAQLSSPFLAMLRNTALRLAPRSIQERQFEKLYRVNF